MLSYGTLTTPDGVADLSFDLTEYLNDGEVLSSESVTPDDTTLIVASNVGDNAAAYVNDDGDTVEIGKGVEFRLTAQKEYTGDTFVRIAYLGDDGSKGSIRVRVPMAPDVTE